MKKILYSAFALSLIACSDSANNTPKATATLQEATADCNYAYISDSTTFQWTGYKTTAKIPVKGTFDSIIVAVAHNEFINYTTTDFKQLSKGKLVLLDIKGIYNESSWKF